MIQEIAELRWSGASTTAISAALHIKHQRVMWIIKKLGIAIEERPCRVCGTMFVPVNPKQFICSVRCKRTAWATKKKAQDRAIREAVIEKLGGKCATCPTDDHRVLQINHLNGGGCREYRSKGSHRIYMEILQGKREGEFDLRCANCNILYSRSDWP